MYTKYLLEIEKKVNIKQMSNEFNDFLFILVQRKQTEFLKWIKSEPRQTVTINGYCVSVTINDKDIEEVEEECDLLLLVQEDELNEKFEDLVFTRKEIHVSENEECELCGVHPAEMSYSYTYSYTETIDEQAHRFIKNINFRREILETLKLHLVEDTQNIFMEIDTFSFLFKPLKNFSFIQNIVLDENKTLKHKFSFLNDGYNKHIA